MAGAGRKTLRGEAKSAQRSLDGEIARLAGAQHGVISLSQLCELGLSPVGVRARVAAGRLHRIHSGVYAVGHPVVPPNGRLLAAVLACGSGAFLSHRSAAALWGIAPYTGPAIDVCSPRRSGRGRDGIRVHRAASLAPQDVTILHAIPCASAARTLLDLAGLVRHDLMERAVGQAELLEIFDLRAVEELLGRAGSRRGTARLRAALGTMRPEAGFTQSDLERRFLALCRENDLPTPAVNAWLSLPDDGFQVDFLWDRPQVIAELDGHRFHRGRLAFELDRSRDQVLAVAGYHVIRFTWRHVVEEPSRVADTLRALLARRDHTSPPVAERG